MKVKGNYPALVHWVEDHYSRENVGRLSAELVVTYSRKLHAEYKKIFGKFTTPNALPQNLIGGDEPGSLGRAVNDAFRQRVMPVLAYIQATSERIFEIELIPRHVAFVPVLVKLRTIMRKLQELSAFDPTTAEIMQTLPTLQDPTIPLADEDVFKEDINDWKPETGDSESDALQYSLRQALTSQILSLRRITINVIQPYKVLAENSAPRQESGFHLVSETLQLEHEIEVDDILRK